MTTVPDFPSKSVAKKTEPAAAPKKDGPEIVQVTSHEAKVRKPSLFKRASRSIVAEDSGSVTEYVILEVLLPAAKNTISDMVSQGIDQLLYGGVRSRRSTGGGGGMINYSTPSKVIGSRTNDPRPMTSRDSSEQTYEDLIYENRGDAEAVLDRLISTIDEYDSCSVAMLMGFAGRTPSWTDEKMGWTNVHNARAKQVRGGYILDLPRPVKLDA